jgi:hypothetical protein
VAFFLLNQPENQMGRSVSTPSEALVVVYASFEGDSDDFDDCRNELQRAAMRKYPSLSRANRWIGNENHVVLENKHCSITVSEYCGLVAVAIVPGSGYGALSERWCDKVDMRPLADCFGPRLVSVGRASNGEQFFQSADGKQRGDMGLGFTSKDGWL